MRRLLYYPGQGVLTSTGLLLLRIVVGAALALHGWPKIQSPFNWMPPESGYPGVLQFLAALSEFGGGIALMIGFLTRLAGLGIGATMTVAAMFHVGRGDPFVSGTGGPSYELATVYLACAILFVLAGPGRLSVDALLFGGPRTRTG